jgi:hypothetical protein
MVVKFYQGQENPKPLTIGNYTAKGILGQEMTVDGSKYRGCIS